MKKRITVIGMMVGVMALMAGCSQSVNPDKYVTLGQYKGLEATKQAVEVTDEEIEQQIQATLEQYATTEEVKDRTTVEKGDIANIDYVGKKDGVAFEGGTADAFDLEIGSGRFIPGFEDGIIGKEVGKTFDLDLTFPEVYDNNPDLAGQDVVFTVTVNSIKEKKVPELDDAFVKTLNAGATTVAEFKDLLKQSILSDKNSQAEQQVSTDLWNQVMESSTVSDDIPEDLIQEKIDFIYDRYTKTAESYNMDLATYLMQAMAIDEAQFKEEIDTIAKDAVKEALVVQAIAKAENLSLTDDEIAQSLSAAASMYGYASEDEFKENNDMTLFNEQMLKMKIDDFIKENATIKDASGAVETDAAAETTEPADADGTAAETEEAVTEDAAAETTAE